MLDRKLIERLSEDNYTTYTIAQLVDAHSRLCSTKVRMRNIDKNHKKHESFAYSVSQKHRIDEELIHIVVDFAQILWDWGTLGGYDEEKEYSKRKERLNKWLVNK